MATSEEKIKEHCVSEFTHEICFLQAFWDGETEAQLEIILSTSILSWSPLASVDKFCKHIMTEHRETLFQ